MDQENLFGDLTDRFADRREEWVGMPEFVQEDLMPFRQLIVNFENQKYIDDFSKLVNQKITLKTRSIWFPESEKAIYKNLRYIDEP